MLAKNFGVNASSFGHTPDPSELYMFKAAVPGPLGSDRLAGAKHVEPTFSHRMLAQEPIKTGSGTVRITELEQLPVRQNHRCGAGRG